MSIVVWAKNGGKRAREVEVSSVGAFMLGKRTHEWVITVQNTATNQKQIVNLSQCNGDCASVQKEVNKVVRQLGG